MKTAYSMALKNVRGGLCPWRRVIPPNRLETTNRELVRALYAIRGRNSREALCEALRQITGRKHVFLAPSGRAAIAHILSVLPSREVVLPAFTCPAVRTAVAVAGRQTIYVDSCTESLNATSTEFEAEARPGRVLLPTHLFGLPTDIDEICALARERGCVTIEDAAACFPSRIDGRLLGTVADFGVFSFERSKRLPAFRGAAIVVNNERVVDVAAFRSCAPVAATDRLPVRELLSALIYNLATEPELYGRFTIHAILRGYRAASRLEQAPGPSAGRDTPFFNRAFHAYQAELVLSVLNRWHIVGPHLRNLVTAYKRALAPSRVRTFVTGACDESGILRFPIAFPGVDRSDILRRALRRGVYLETNYEDPLVPVSARAKFPNARWAADNIVLLPLYARLPLEAAEMIAREVVAISEEACPVLGT
jgi:dTDP-4-amino-4,6-dideoxygalactose transaminase